MAVVNLDDSPKRNKKGLIGTIINLFMWLVMIVLLGSLALSIFSSSITQFNYQTYLIQSGSMEPTIMTGDMIVINKTADYQVNDVITFTDNGARIVTHRILERKLDDGNPVFLTQGDANQSPDPHLIPESDVHGEVVFTIPRIGYLVRFSKTRTGIIVLILAPIIIMAYEEIIKIFEALRKK